MSMSCHQDKRRVRRLTPLLEPMEGKVLLSAGMGALAHAPEAHVLRLAARAARLAVNGRINGQFSYQTSADLNEQVTIAVQGNSGNGRVGPLSAQSTFTASLSFLSGLASGPSTVSVPSFQIQASGGTIDSTGTLQINPTLRRSPFRMTATITGGTGQFTGATGNLTIQGTSFSLTTGRLAGTLRGTILTHA